MNIEKYYEFGKTLTKEEQLKFVAKMKLVMLAVKINPDILHEAMEDVFKEYPKFKECL